MNQQQAKQKGFTHHGKMYGFPIYLTDDEDMNIEGINWFYDKLVELFIYIDIAFKINDAFPILKGKKIN